MDFDERLQKAIDRGQSRLAKGEQEAAAKELSEDDYRSLHSKYQLQVSEHIEQCLQKVASHFPGFGFETVVGERGWGGAIRRDDFGRGSGGGRSNFYSRLEMTVRPYGSHHVLELTAKGTIRNKELFSRKHFKLLEEADPDLFEDLVDTWSLEYAELYAAKG